VFALLPIRAWGVTAPANCHVAVVFSSMSDSLQAATLLISATTISGAPDGSGMRSSTSPSWSLNPQLNAMKSGSVSICSKEGSIITMKTHQFISFRQISILLALVLLLSGAAAPRLFAQVNIGSGGFNSTNLCFDPSSPSAGCQVVGNGDATLSSGYLQLTTSTGNQFGSAWAVTPQTVVNGFTTTFVFQFTNPSSPPADGIAFVIQNSGLGAIGYTGGNGGAIGYGDDDANAYPNTGIPSSLAIEFDSYLNGWDPDADHVAVQSCGTAYNTSHHNQSCSVTGGSEVNSTLGITAAGALAASGVTITDGNPHTVTIQYTPGTPCNASNSKDTNNLCIYIDQENVTPPVPALTVSVNLSMLLKLGTGGTAYVGFTGATGGDWETQDILSWSFSQTIVGTPVQPGTTQTFPFNTTSGSVDIVSAIIPPSSITLVNADATPIITAFSVPPSNPSSLWANSPLATATCIAFVSAGGNCAPILVVCAIPGATLSGVDCPYDVTGAEDVLLSDDFNPVTPFTSTSISATQNPGVVALNDSQTCPFAAPFANLPCPSNGLKSFSGDPTPVHGSSNSYYYYVTGVLPPLTTPAGFVNVVGPKGTATTWISQNPNTQSPLITLTAAPPTLPSSITNPNGWYPSPIDYIAYVNLLSTAAAPNPNYPLNLQNAEGVVTPGNPLGAVVDFSENTLLTSGYVTSSGIATPPTPPTPPSTCGSVLESNGDVFPAISGYSFQVPVNLGTLADKTTYALYYETEDCTRTAERLYAYSASSLWTTNYKSVVYTVDNDPPVISITVPSEGAIYPAKATIASSFSCSDGTGSGVASCNGASQINTTPGGSILTPQTFTVTSSDNVGNTSPPQTVNYFVSCLYAENTVSPSTFARGQGFTITPSVTNCTKSLQPLTVSVVLSGPMGTSCTTKSLTLVNGITVPVPAGLSVKATFGPFSVPKSACAGTYSLTTTSTTNGVTDFTYSSSITVN
jgi:hypothetical protein